MTTHTATSIGTKTARQKVLAFIACTGQMRHGESILVNPPTNVVEFTQYAVSDDGTEAPTNDLTIENESVNTTVQHSLQRDTVAIGQGLFFDVSGGVSGSLYAIEILVDTSGGYQVDGRAYLRIL